MANVALRASWLGSTLSRAAVLLVAGCLMLGLGVMAGAQDPAKKADPKKADPKKTEPDKKTDAKSTDTPSKGAEVSGSGFAALDEATKIINENLSAAWKANNLTPAPRCDDHEFIRRATLDIIGRIATVKEIDEYMKWTQAERRGKLLDKLLNSDEYSKNWATVWTHWLMTRTGDKLYRDQIELWLEDEVFATGVDSKGVPRNHMNYKEFVTKLITANGKTNDNGAVNYILAHLGGPTAGNGRNGGPDEAKRKAEGEYDVVPITSRTVRLFLGYQIQCTQCHDHPFNADWKQKHFWGVNAFFRQVHRDGTPPGRAQNNQMMANPVLTLSDDTRNNVEGIVYYEKRSGVYLPSVPIFLDNRKIPQGGQLPRREELSRFVTSHKNFNRAYVNRMWAHMFGRGMNVKPAADDFGEHNELVHEELLTALGKEFEQSGAYDPRKLIKWICSSDAYNLKSVANKTNESPEAEPYFSRMQLKMMSPEQLLESLMTATNPKGEADKDATLKDAQKNLRRNWMNTLVRNFGDDEGNEVSFNGTVVQALLMMNGKDLNSAISAGSGTVQAASKFKSPKQTMDYLFLATLNRPATQKELGQVLGKLPIRAKESDPQGPLQDLFWALLNCNEFILNH